MKWGLRHHDFSQEAVAAYKDELSKNHFAILILACASAGEYQPICVALNLPLGTVKSRLHRARKVLSALIADARADEICAKNEKDAA